VEQCFAESGISRADIRLVIPHQASRALDVIMPRLGFAKNTYLDRVKEYGNMVSASVPFAMCEAFDEGMICPGDLVLLIGTAAGLTSNFMIVRV